MSKPDPFKEMLGKMVDLSLTTIGVNTVKTTCKFCGDQSINGRRVRHYHNCIVAQAQELLDQGHENEF